MKEVRKSDNLPVLDTCWSVTSAMLSSISSVSFVHFNMAAILLQGHPAYGDSSPALFLDLLGSRNGIKVLVCDYDQSV